MKKLVRPAIAVVSAAVLVGLAALTPQAHEIATTVGRTVDSIVQPPPSPSPSPLPTPIPGIGSASGGGVSTLPPVTREPIPTPSPTYPIVHGAPCVPPGTVVDGQCVVVPGIGGVSSPAPAGPAPSQPQPQPTPNTTPGHGAPCLPPGVVQPNGDCVVPAPTPSPTPS